MSTPTATTSEVFYFEDFSDEVILKVVSFLDLNARFNCYLTSKRLRALCQDHTLPSMWQKIHLYGPNILSGYSKTQVDRFTKELLKVNEGNYLQSTTLKPDCLKHAQVNGPCENLQLFCGKMNNIPKEKTKNYLNLNIENFDGESIQGILDKGCKYLLMSDILPRVGCQMIPKIFKEKEFLELKEVVFTWCVPGIFEKPNHHYHPCISLHKYGYGASSFDCTCQKHACTDKNIFDDSD